MILIVGLGNPGKSFFQTRHNLGFAFVNTLKRLGDFSDWKMNKNFESKISEGKLFGKKVVLIKPQTFMNNSGKAVKKIVEFYKLPLENLWVVHDDIDLDLGKLKIVKNRGSGGHKGVESIIKELGSKDFVRFRLGIKPKEIPKNFNKKDFVLEKFSKEEKKIVKEIFKTTIQAVEIALKQGVEKAMSEFNKKRSSA
jgi:PTH1 family peptidyl-tRNA hydrolase